MKTTKEERSKSGKESKKEMKIIKKIKLNKQVENE